MHRNFHVIYAAALAALTSGVSGAPDQGAKTPRLRPTHEQLTEGRGVVRQSSHQSVRLNQVPIGEVTKKRSDQASLVGRSTVLSFGDFWTLVPKGAVLHVPEGLKGRVGTAPSGRLLGWSEFYQRNRGWLRQQAVEVSHARGERLLDEEVVKNFTSLTQVVVATCHSGPISMKKPVVPEAAAN
jgi:hypothetical protein